MSMSLKRQAWSFRPLLALYNGPSMMNSRPALSIDCNGGMGGEWRCGDEKKILKGESSCNMTPQMEPRKSGYWFLPLNLLGPPIGLILKVFVCFHVCELLRWHPWAPLLPSQSHLQPCCSRGDTWAWSARSKGKHTAKNGRHVMSLRFSKAVIWHVSPTNLA